MEQNQKKIKKAPRLFRIAIAALCVVMTICMVYVMFNLYIPSHNALGALSSVCMDVICMIILFILIGSIIFGNFESTKTTKIFSLLLVATAWATFLDFLNWAFDGTLEFGGVTYLFTVGSLCMGSILACIFCMYLYKYMEENHNLTQMKIGARVCAIMNLVSFVITLVLALTKTAFDFVDGHYETGALYDVVTAIPVITLVFLTIFTIVHVKKVGIHDVIAVVGYILFMIAGALIESEYSIGTTYVAVSIADLFIFIMLQNEVITLEKRNAEKWMQRSNTDELTGCYSRYAYEEEMTSLEAETPAENFVYVSVDVNALKEVNDTYGHNEGDELLIGAAECLKQCIGEYGRLYRTGGDEFAALLYADEAQLEQIRKNLKEATANWKGSTPEKLTISCGYASKKTDADCTVRKMAILADHRMYEAKAAYYRETGKERRKK